MIITTTATIEKKTIIEYLDVVTGADTYTIGGIIGEGFLKQNMYFNQAVMKAYSQMKTAAQALGADGIVGVQLSSTSMASSGSIVVTAIGTAVKLAEGDWEEDLPDL